eukprot:SAG11_NODE_1737_length_4343_cov_2.762488_4_plen_219_part_00
MTQTTFLQEIRCNSNSYGRFMSFKGAWQGAQNGVYFDRFFERRARRAAWEKKNNPAAAKRKRQGAAAENQKKAKLGGEVLGKLAAVDYAEVPIYDSCPEVRRKVNAFMKTAGMSQAAFLRAVAGGGSVIAPNSFKSFMAAKPVPRTDARTWARTGQAGARTTSTRRPTTFSRSSGWPRASRRPRPGWRTKRSSGRPAARCGTTTASAGSSPAGDRAAL